MRAIAIVAVLLCHSGLAFAAGGYVGVDVFFVISGFLITRLLLAELERHGRISLTRFYARRAKRLLPLALVVLLSVAVLSRLLFSPVRGHEVSADVVSSAFYMVNWRFAAQSVDYFAQGTAPSPVQHLWSLAIEEQFYLVWPSLILLATWWWRRSGRPVRPALWAMLLLAAGASLAIGIQLTAETPASAYFSTPGRAWELALGGCLALIGAVRIPRPLIAVLAWAGLAAIGFAAVRFGPTTPFPGVAALVPTLGAAGLILAGSSARGTVPSRLLSLGPVRYVGRISYAWYLWHWPALVFAASLWGPLSTPARLAAIGASWIPTVITHHLIEEPFRRSKALLRPPRRALALGLSCTAAAATAGLLLAVLQPALRTAPASDVKGVAALANEPTPQREAVAVRPNPLRARDDRSAMFSDGCLVGEKGTRSNHCVYGDAHGKRTLVLFGDSHAMQYFPALEPLARRKGLRLIALAKADCTPANVKILDQESGGEFSECEAWREDALRRIESAGPNTAVVLSGASDYTPLDAAGHPLDGKARLTALRDGYRATLERLRRQGLRSAVIKDPPAAPDDVPSCVSENMKRLDACAFRRRRQAAQEFDAWAVQQVRGAHLIDVSKAVCPKDVCRAVIGNALVYRDNNHLSATFARTLEPWIERGLRGASLL